MEILFRILIMIICWSIAGECLANQSAWYFTSNDINSLHSKPADYRIPYGNSPLQFGDLRLPNGKGPFPVAIIIHGGCWISTFATIQNTSALADALRDIGIATWNIEYRRIDNEGGGWPGTFEDIAHATDFLRKIADHYSLDLTHLIIIGHSAGGHLALWAAARHQLSSTSPLYMQHPLIPRGVIVLGGIPDLKAFRQFGENICDADVVGKLLGNSPNQIVTHYKDASPNELLPLGVPQVLIYGSEDESVPAKFGAAYAQSAREKGDHVKFITVQYAAHHEYIVPNSVTWPMLRSAISSLLH